MRAGGEGGGAPGGGDAGLKRARYRYRLLPHVLAIEHAGWRGLVSDRHSTTPGFRIDTMRARRGAWPGATFISIL